MAGPRDRPPRAVFGLEPSPISFPLICLSAAAVVTSIGIQADTCAAIGTYTALSQTSFSALGGYGDGWFALVLSTPMADVQAHESQKNQGGGGHDEKFNRWKHIPAYPL